MTKAETILFLAQAMGIETLDIRGRDFLDFHEVGVASLKAALEGAYEAGRQAALAERATYAVELYGDTFTAAWQGEDIIVTRSSDRATALILADTIAHMESEQPLQDCAEMIADMDRGGDVHWETEAQAWNR